MCRLVNHALLEHLCQDQLLALLDLLRMVVHIINRRVVGQSGEHGAFRKRQLGHILAEIAVCCSLHAVATVAKKDRIQIHGQDAVLIVYHILKCERAENLIDLALDRIVVLICCVLNELLGNGRAAVLRTAEQPVFHRAKRAFPVHTVVRIKTLVLDRDRSIL